MKTYLVIISFIPLITWSQDSLVIKGKMIYGDTKEATVQIVDKENPSDTTTIKIYKKKFQLEPLDISKSYELIFISGNKSKSLNIEGRKEGEEKEHSYFLEINWKNI